MISFWYPFIYVHVGMFGFGTIVSNLPILQINWIVLCVTKIYYFLRSFLQQQWWIVEWQRSVAFSLPKTVIISKLNLSNLHSICLTFQQVKLLVTLLVRKVKMLHCFLLFAIIITERECTCAHYHHWLHESVVLNALM